MLKFSLAEIGLCARGSYIGPQYDYRIVRGQNIRGGQVIFSHFVNNYYFRGCCLHCRKGRKVATFVGKYSRFNHKNHKYFNFPPPSENYLLYQTLLSHPVVVSLPVYLQARAYGYTLLSWCVLLTHFVC